MKKKQSNDLRKEEAEEKKEHFIHTGPKLKAARESTYRCMDGQPIDNTS